MSACVVAGPIPTQCEGMTAYGSRCFRDAYQPIADGRYLCWQHRQIWQREEWRRVHDRLTTEARDAGLSDGAVEVVSLYAFGDYRRLNERRGPGIVYLVRQDGWSSGALHKIGITHGPSPAKRLNSMQHAIGMPITLVDFATVNNARRAETHLFQLFAEKRGLGEWFQLDDADVSLAKCWISALGFLAMSSTVRDVEQFAEGWLRAL